jgi:hypothetical protein
MYKKICLAVIAFVFIFGFAKPAFGIDIYFPQSFEWKASQEWASLVEVTVLSNTRVEGVPQGYSGYYHYLLALQLDNVITDGTALNLPSVGDEVSIVAHYSVVLTEGQRYLVFINSFSLDGRWIAEINEDGSISATSTGVYFVPYDGYTVEQLKALVSDEITVTVTLTRRAMALLRAVLEAVTALS